MQSFLILLDQCQVLDEELLVLSDCKFSGVTPGANRLGGAQEANIVMGEGGLPSVLVHRQ